jgi:N,N-dimethylformamidase
MLKITGYADRVSAMPGDAIRFMINCEYPHYQASVVRVVQGDTAPEAPPVKLVPVPSAIDGRHPGRPQVIHAGSFARIDGDIFAGSRSFSSDDHADDPAQGSPSDHFQMG